MIVIGSVSSSALNILHFVRVGPGEIAPSVDARRALLRTKSGCHWHGCNRKKEDVLNEHVDRISSEMGMIDKKSVVGEDLML